MADITSVDLVRLASEQLQSANVQALAGGWQVDLARAPWRR